MSITTHAVAHGAEALPGDRYGRCPDAPGHRPTVSRFRRDLPPERVVAAARTSGS